MRVKSMICSGAVLVALLLSGCSTGGAGGSGGGSAQPQGQPQEGGTAVVGIADEPDALDPTTSGTFVAREVYSSICEKLFDTDAKLEIHPQLAAALPEISADGLSYTIKVREGVKFNDGTPLDAAAVKATLDRHLKAKVADLLVIKQVDVVDPMTVRLTLSHPSGTLTSIFADKLGIVMSPAAIEKLGDDFGSAPVCVGPFKFVKRVSGSEIDVEKSDDYYDKDKVRLDGIKYKFISDANVRAVNLKSGDINVADQLNVSDAVNMKDPQLVIEKVASISAKTLIINQDPSSDSPLAKSADLRKAFEMSISRDGINKSVYNGQNVSDCIPIPLTSPFRPDKVSCRTFDPAAAKKIVEASGQTMPVPVSLMVPTTPVMQKVGEVIQSMAEQAGFKVSVEPVELVSSLDKVRTGDFQVYLNAFSGRIDPDGFLTNRLDNGSKGNWGHYRDDESDKLIKDAAASNDPAERKKLYTQLFERFSETVPSIFLYHDTLFTGLNGITGVEYYPDGIPRFKTAALVK